jgi:uncharacterized membrane protein
VDGCTNVEGGGPADPPDGPTPAVPPPPGTLREEDELGFGRIVAFSDGVFAVAITLLVLTIDPPVVRDDLSESELVDRLTGLLPQIEVYFLAFAVVGLFWIGHHRFFRDLRAFDRGLMILNLGYLSLVAFLPLPVAVFGDHAGRKGAVIFFALSMGAIGLADAAMTVYAARRRLLGPSAYARRRQLVLLNLIAPSVFFASIPVALVDATLAPWLWLAIVALSIVGNRVAADGRDPESA